MRPVARGDTRDEVPREPAPLQRGGRGEFDDRKKAGQRYWRDLQEFPVVGRQNSVGRLPVRQSSPSSEARVAYKSDRVECDVSSRERSIDWRTRAACDGCSRRTDGHHGCTGRSGRLRRLPFVAVMKAADFRNCDDRPSGRCRDGSGIWRVLVEPKMRATPMIVSAVDREDASQMRLIEHDHVIQAFSTN